MPKHPFTSRVALLALGLVALDLCTSMAGPNRPGQRRRTVQRTVATASATAASTQLTQAITASRRLMYVWDHTIPGQDKPTKELFKFAQSRGLTTLAIDAVPVGLARPGGVDRYKRFVLEAHANGLQVLALGGNPWWTVPAAANRVNQDSSQEAGWDFYSRIASSGIAFDGILDVSVPYLTDSALFWSQPAAASAEYLVFLHGVRSRIGTLSFFHAIPYWYDEDARLSLVLENETQPRPLNFYVQRSIDTAVVLESRDVALGNDGLLAHFAGEVNTGPCVLGIETQDLGAGSSSQTFWEEGRRVMDREMGIVFVTHALNPNFRGFAVHHYGSYSRLKN